MSRAARKLLAARDAGKVTDEAVVAAWERRIIDRAEFGAIIGKPS